MAEISKGQQAMAKAMLYPEPEKLKRRSPETGQQDISKQRLLEARQVLHYSEALAMLYPEPEKGGRGKKKERLEETSTVSAKRLQQARALLRFSEPLARRVLTAWAAWVSSS